MVAAQVRVLALTSFPCCRGLAGNRIDDKL
jgi:hypothetical protein